MTQLIKHLGKRKSTGVKVAIVYMQLPNDTNNCLVVDIDSLADTTREDFMALIVSREAQKARQLYEIMNLKQYFGNHTFLSAFHESRSLMKVATTDIVVTLDSETVIDLDELNKQMFKLNNATEDFSDAQIDDARNAQKIRIEGEESELNRKTAESVMWQALDLEDQAKLLLEEAARKRADAERMMGVVTTNKAKRTASVAAPVVEDMHVATPTAKKAVRKPAAKKATVKK